MSTMVQYQRLSILQSVGVAYYAVDIFQCLGSSSQNNYSLGKSTGIHTVLNFYVRSSKMNQTLIVMVDQTWIPHKNQH